MTQAVQRYQPTQMGIVPQGIQEVAEIAKMVETSKSFPTVKNAAEAAVRIMMGAEIGLGPMQSLTSIHVVEGRPTLSANLMAALMRRSGYSWRVLEHTNDVCRLEIRHNGSILGESSFTSQEASDAQLLGRANWKKHRRDMLFARAISRAARWYAPEVALGVYLPDEMGEVESPMPAAQVFQSSQITAPIEAVADVEVAEVSEEPEPVASDSDLDIHRRRFFAVAGKKGLTEGQQRALLGVASRKDATPERFLECAQALEAWGQTEREMVLACLETNTVEEMRDLYRSLPDMTRDLISPSCKLRSKQLQEGT